MDYIKGTYIKEVYNNKDNGYTVGVLKLKESNSGEREWIIKIKKKK